MMMKAPMMQMMVVIGHWMMSYAQDTCMSNPCLNGGLCQSYDGVYTCLCPSDYSGANCETQMEYHPLDPVISVDPGFAIDPDTSLLPPPVGMGQDEHGCYADGGYQWCDQLKECVRPWENPCDSTVSTITENPYTIPNDCVEWYDGCNRCTVSNGLLQLCSMMMCFSQGTPECLAHTRLSVGDVCHRFCEDGSENSVHSEDRCPEGSDCVAPDTISFDSCGSNAWTCQESH